MSIGRLVVREILFRKLGFLLSVLAVAAAVGCLVNQIFLLEEHDRRTERLLAAKEQETKQVMAKLADEMRIITKNLGFNVYILPKDLNLRDFHTRDYFDSYMPEEYVTRLSKSRAVTINHLMPILQQRVVWPEQKDLPIILVGTRGEVPIQYQDKKKPIQDAVTPGKIVLGHWPGEGYKRGDKVVLRGRAFTVAAVHAPRGNDDDKTVWINLKEAQEMAGKAGLINGMLALGCNCTSERLSVIRDEITAILPDTQVEEFASIAKARAEARTKVGEEADAALARERAHQAALRQDREAFAAALVPAVLVAACFCLGQLALSNVRQRRGEIGLLRALGLQSGQLMVLFLTRALAVGLLGGVLGCVAGTISLALIGAESDEVRATLAGQMPLLLSILLAAPAVSLLACWLPTLIAVRQDPAVILQQEA
jgi:hypothetical protein